MDHRNNKTVTVNLC